MTDSQKWMLLAVTGISLGLLYLLTPVLMPFMVAAFFGGQWLGAKYRKKKQG